MKYRGVKQIKMGACLPPQRQVSVLNDWHVSEEVAGDEKGGDDDGAEDEPHVGDAVEVLQGRSCIEGGLQVVLL